VGMGVLPLQFVDGQSADSLGLSGQETFSVEGLAKTLDGNWKPGSRLTVAAKAADGGTKRFDVLLRIDTPNEVEYYKNGGILQFVLRRLLS
ncbi:MAG: hypothetical protein ACKO32_05695, partial [Planctomycetia bacterium]